MIYIGQRQTALIDAHGGLDYSEVWHQNHILFWRPWVLIPYFALVGSALFFLLGSTRNNLVPHVRKWALVAIFVSLVTYTCTLFFVR